MFALTIYIVIAKKLNVFFSDKIFEESGYNEVLGIDIPKVLINLISCHGFTKKTKSTVILVCKSCFVNYYLEKSFVIIEHSSKQLSSVKNDVNFRIHDINKKDYIMLWRATHKFTL